MPLRLLLAFFFFGGSLVAFGQPTGTHDTPISFLPQRSPGAPTTAALERYALMPVSEPAGTPTISIPLYEARSGSLSVPVTLSYHASGVRVADMASWAGLGWSLQAGGVITRSMRGRPDEGLNGFRTYYNAVPDRDTTRLDDLNAPPGMGDYHTNLIEAVASNQLDYQADLYSFNMLGQSGSFMQGNDGVYHTFPQQAVRIQFQQDTAIMLTDASGATYLFGSREFTRTGAKPPAPSNYCTAWYLDRIVSADRADTIRFEYVRHFVEYTTLQQQQTLVSSVDEPNWLSRPPSDSFEEGDNPTNVRTLKLQRILFRGGEVNLNSVGGRQDVSGDTRLTSLTVLAGQNRDTLRQVRFYHSYFNPNYQPEERRLRLDSVATTAPGLQLPPHTFTYNTAVALPNRRTGVSDHWGYCNGAVSGILIPTTPVQRWYGPPIYQGADREPHPAFVQAGMLTQITYPTGGKHQFTYEPNTVAEQYQVPNEPTAITYHSDNTLPVDTWRTVRYQLAIPDSVAEGVYSAHASPNGGPLPTDPDEPDPNDTGRHSAAFTITDITDLNNPHVVVDASANLGAVGDPQPWVGAAVFVLAANHTYEVAITTRSATLRVDITYESIRVKYSTRNKIVGGVRLKEQRIQASAQAPVTIKRYYYHTPGSSLSSGYLLSGSQPVYARMQKTRVPPSNPDYHQGPLGGATVNISYTVLSSNSVTDISSDRVAGYSYVTVVDSASTGETAGKIVSHYRRATDGGGGWKPPTPKSNAGWLRDQLLSQKTYGNASPGPDQLLTKVENTYDLRMMTDIVGFTASQDVNIQTDLRMAQLEGLQPYVWENTREMTGWLYLTQSQQYRYAKGNLNSYQLTTTRYRYDNPRHQQPTQVETLLASGQRQQTRTRYAADYDTLQVSTGTGLGAVSARAVRQLLRQHAVAHQLEQTTIRFTGTDSLVTQSSLTLPQVLAPGVVVPARQLTFRTLAPHPLAAFPASRLTNGELTYAAGYQADATVDAYDAQRRVAQYHPEKGGNSSFLWDQVSGQPVAEAKQAALNQLAYSSFEPTAPGNWSFAPAQRWPGGYTGTGSYKLQSGGVPVARTGLVAGRYQLSFWTTDTPTLLVDNVAQPLGTAVRTAGAWRLYQLTLPVSSALRFEYSGGGLCLLDELRLHPVGSLLTTYTYTPLVGMSSQTDATGRTLFYAYDALGRLLQVRDEQGRLLSTQEYHYARRP